MQPRGLELRCFPVNFIKLLKKAFCKLTVKSCFRMLRGVMHNKLFQKLKVPHKIYLKFEHNLSQILIYHFIALKKDFGIS